MNMMEQSAVTLLLLLPRPWLAAEERETRRDVEVDIGGQASVLEQTFRRGRDVYARGTVRDSEGRAQERLAYWHKVVVVDDRATEP